MSSFLLTRFYLDRLGAATYGLYQMVYSVAQYILILDLGISTVMVRYISEFEAHRDKDRVESFGFHFAVIVGLISGIILLIGLVVNQNLEHIYRTLSIEEYSISHRLFRIMVAQLILTVVGHYFRGICEAYERFVFTRSISVLQILINIILTILFLNGGMGVIGITMANTISLSMGVIASASYSLIHLHFKIRFHGWDPEMMRPAFLLMLAMLLQSVVGHVNGSVDKTILGIMARKEDVAVYSICAAIVTMLNSLPSTVSSVLQPAATRLVISGADSIKLTDYVARWGRIQFMIVGGFLSGFALIGKDFIWCWAGKGMTKAWLYALIIIIPNSVPLVQNMMLAVLNAKDKRLFRSVVLAGMTGINILLTLLLIRALGPIGAPLGTGISYILGHIIVMNLYYRKNLQIDIKRMFSIILNRTWTCVTVSFLLLVPIFHIVPTAGSWLILLAKAAIFLIVYLVLLLLHGFHPEEKELLKKVLRRSCKNNEYSD